MQRLIEQLPISVMTKAENARNFGCFTTVETLRKAVSKRLSKSIAPKLSFKRA